MAGSCGRLRENWGKFAVPYPNPPQPQDATPLHRGHARHQRAREGDTLEAIAEKLRENRGKLCKNARLRKKCDKLRTSVPPPHAPCPTQRSQTSTSAGKPDQRSKKRGPMHRPQPTCRCARRPPSLWHGRLLGRPPPTTTTTRTSALHQKHQAPLRRLHVPTPRARATRPLCPRPRGRRRVPKANRATKTGPACGGTRDSHTHRADRPAEEHVRAVLAVQAVVEHQVLDAGEHVERPATPDIPLLEGPRGTWTGA